MITQLRINNSTVSIEAKKDETLLTVLRRENITSVKCGCTKGMCGACTVLLDNKPIPSCLVPMGFLSTQHIISLEHFALTNDYEDIIQGLESAEVSLCGFCNTGKIFAIHELINNTETPNRTDIERRMRTYTCPCTNTASLISAIYNAYDIRLERHGREEYGRK